MRIVDLARDLIRLSGLREGQDIHIVYSGIRDGEKLHEQLANVGEHAHPTEHPKIFVGKIHGPSLCEIEAWLAGAQVLIEKEAAAPEVKAFLQRLVPEYQQPEYQQWV
jgi:FlaA1/EpsC-like NDP-sugar epimerase